MNKELRFISKWNINDNTLTLSNTSIIQLLQANTWQRQNINYGKQNQNQNRAQGHKGDGVGGGP